MEDEMTPKAAGSLGINEKVAITLTCEEWLMVSSALEAQAARSDVGMSPERREEYVALYDKVGAATRDPKNVSPI